MKQSELNKYFNSVWKSNIDQYTHSGWNLIDKVKDDELVLDVGCGYNPFKDKIKNLVGIDPAFVEADYQTTIEQFQTDQKFDVAFCLGSINFGSEKKIIKQINSVIKLLKPTARIYWRCNPGRKDHNNKECEKIDFYPWSLDKHISLSEQFGFKLTEFAWDNDTRIYAEWTKK